MARAFRILAALIALIGLGWSQAHAQVPTTGAGRGTPAAPASYTGPGDVVSGATGWWGFRAYNAAYAVSHGNVVQVCESTGVSCVIVTANTNGTITPPGVTACGGGACTKVKTLYDQTGNGNDLAQTTAASMPTFNGTGIYSISVAGGFGGTIVNSGNIAVAQPFSMSSVALRVTNGVASDEAFFVNGNSGAGVVFTTSLNIELHFVSAALVSSNAYTLNTATAINALVNSPAGATTSAVYVDGTNTTGNAGTGDFTAAPVSIYGGLADVIKFTEGGIWAGDKSANFATLNTNQHTFWGF